MATKTLYLKEDEGTILDNPIGQLSSVPWWSMFGSQSMSIEQHNSVGGAGQFTSAKQPGPGSDQVLDKGCPIQFTIFPGDSKTAADAPKPPQSAISLQTVMPEHGAHVELGFGQPMICAKYPHMDQYYGLFSAYGAQISGRIMLPMNLTTDDGPIYVNPKQYHGIMRRRKSRAKAVSVLGVTQRKKQFMHLSRHLHAKRRPRGPGGRFLNSNELKKEKDWTEMNKPGGETYLSQSAVSQSSEVPLPDSGTLSSPKEANGCGSVLSESEVTSIYTREYLDCFQNNHLGLPIHAFSGIMDNGRGIFIPTKWVAVVSDGCCNSNV